MSLLPVLAVGHRSITGCPLSPPYLLTLKGVAHLSTPAPVAELAEDTFTRVGEAGFGLLGHTPSARRTGAPAASAALPVTGLLLLHLRVVTVHVTVHHLCSVKHLPVIGNMLQPARDNPRHVQSCHPGVELNFLVSAVTNRDISLRGGGCLDAMMLLDIIKYIVNTLK